MRILLTNDDGIGAPGLLALREELEALGEVTIVAPATDHSASSHAVTLRTPLFVQEVYAEGRRLPDWAVSGHPADCVKLAIRELLPDPPDLVVSGLNRGSNAGIYILYSGTVAAAVEAALSGRVAVAVSLDDASGMPPDFRRGARMALRAIERILAEAPAPGVLFNVNIPDPRIGPGRGIRFVPQSMAPYVEYYLRRTAPDGRPYYWINSELSCPDAGPDTDVAALAEGYVAVTPLHVDLTDSVLLRRMREPRREPLP